MAWSAVHRAAVRPLRRVALCSRNSSSAPRASVAQLQVSVGRRAAQQPALLCSRGGSFTQRGVSASAGVADAQEVAGAGEELSGEATTQRRLRVLSGVQPTGSIHLGNYLGAIRNWVALQETYDTFYCVVDLHAVTAPHEPKLLAEATRTVAALYLASGVDPQRSTVFVQSHVTAHSELAWLLNCVTPVGWLGKMIQFKEKARKQGEEVSMGLMDYPVLMAADILLYGADLVPVGEDQRQHLELTRDISGRFNALYGGKALKARKGLAPSGRARGGRVLKVPEALIPPQGARVMSLDDGSSKLSKSNPDEGSRINLLDSAAKIKRCKTDTLPALSFDDPQRPEAANLLTIYQLCSGQSRAAVEQQCSALRWSEFKPLLAEAVVEHLRPLQQRYREITSEPALLDEVLLRGAEAAEEAAQRTLADVQDALGYLPRPRRLR